MKKLLTLAAVAMLIFCLTTASYAVEVGIHGFLKNLTALGVNLGWPETGFGGPPRAIPTPADTDYNDTFAWNMIWTHLEFDIVASEDLRGFIMFEAGAAPWGGESGHGAFWPGYTANVTQAYVDFKVPGTDVIPTRAVVGLQTWAFTPPLAMLSWGPGLRLNSTMGPAAVSVFWAKHEEGLIHRSDDMDSYGGSISMPAGPVSISAWEMYFKIRDNAATAAAAGIGSKGWHSYTGIGVRGTFGPVAVVGDFVYGMQEVDYSVNDGIFDGEETSGWVARVTGATQVGMFTVGGDFCYATGDDLNDVTNKREWSGYKYPIVAKNYMAGNVAALLDAALVYYPSGINVFPGLTNGPGGDWYARAFARVKPLDWLTVSISGMYIADNVDNGDRLGTALTDPTNPASPLEDNSDIGIELDLVTTIQIYDNLTYEIGAGILMAGDALDQYDSTNLRNDSPDDPWVILSGLTYVF